MSDPISAYFAQYPKFSFWPSQSDWRQKGPFNALAMHERWTQAHRLAEFSKLQETWVVFVEAEFSGNTLYDYQQLCGDLGFYPIPDTIDECKEKLSTVFVNIVELVQYRIDLRHGSRPAPLRFFNSAQELREYMEANEKWCPIKNARAEILRALFRVIY
jgi:hypothetical protein